MRSARLAALFAVVAAVSFVLVLLVFVAAGRAAPGPLNPTVELVRAKANAQRWCETHFQNPLETAFIGCQYATAELLISPRTHKPYPATAGRVRMEQVMSGGLQQACAGGCLDTCPPGVADTRPDLCHWAAYRRYSIIIHRGVRRVLRTVWRCTPLGTNAPLSFTGVRCFAGPR